MYIRASLSFMQVPTVLPLDYKKPYITRNVRSESIKKNQNDNEDDNDNDNKEAHAPINNSPTMTLAIVMGGVRTRYAQNTVRERRRSKGENVSVSVGAGLLVAALARCEICEW